MVDYCIGNILLPKFDRIYKLTKYFSTKNV